MIPSVSLANQVLTEQKYSKSSMHASGLVVMGGDSYSEGRVFESHHCLLDGHFFTLTCKNFNVCLKRPKINEIEAGDGPFKTCVLRIYKGHISQVFTFYQT